MNQELLLSVADELVRKGAASEALALLNSAQSSSPEVQFKVFSIKLRCAAADSSGLPTFVTTLKEALKFCLTAQQPEWYCALVLDASTIFHQHDRLDLAAEVAATASADFKRLSDPVNHALFHLVGCHIRLLRQLAGSKEELEAGQALVDTLLASDGKQGQTQPSKPESGASSSNGSGMDVSGDGKRKGASAAAAASVPAADLRPAGLVLSVYHSALTLSYMMQSGVWAGATARLDAMKEAAEGLSRLMQASQSAAGQGAAWPVSWQLSWLQPTVLQVLSAVFTAVQAKNRSEMEEAFGAVQGGLQKTAELKADAGPVELQLASLRFELLGHLVTGRLIQCEFEQAQQALLQLIQLATSRPLLTASPQARARLLQVHLLCADYLACVGLLPESSAHLKQALQLCSDEASAAFVRLHVVAREFGRDPASLSRVEKEVAELTPIAERRDLQAVRVACLTLSGLVKSLRQEGHASREQLRAGIIAANDSLRNKKLQGTALTYLGTNLLEAGSGVQADEALSSALMLAAKMRDTVSQLAILSPLMRVSSGDPSKADKVEKLVLYRSKREEELRPALLKALSSPAHQQLAKWSPPPLPSPSDAMQTMADRGRSSSREGVPPSSLAALQGPPSRNCAVQ